MSIEGEAVMSRALYDRELELLFRLNVVEKLMNVTGCLLKHPDKSWRSHKFSKEELAAVKSLYNEIKSELKNCHGVDVDKEKQWHDD